MPVDFIAESATDVHTTYTYIPDVHAWNSSSSSIVPLLPNSLIKFAASALQCCSIENQQSPFFVVNRVTLTVQNLYQKS